MKARTLAIPVHPAPALLPNFVQVSSICLASSGFKPQAEFQPVFRILDSPSCKIIEQQTGPTSYSAMTRHLIPVRAF